MPSLYRRDTAASPTATKPSAKKPDAQPTLMRGRHPHERLYGNGMAFFTTSCSRNPSRSAGPPLLSRDTLRKDPLGTTLPKMRGVWDGTTASATLSSSSFRFLSIEAESIPAQRLHPFGPRSENDLHSKISPGRGPRATTA